MKFELSDKQIAEIAEWKAGLYTHLPKTAIGGAFTYSFTPTNIGMVVKVEYYDGSELDVSEYEDW